ncbi:MAG TPA: sigma 54-interacting transcriptional regulator [Kofleriaceae bacterium]|nr:sigma 54-interacting transcriptional regulator [Kofleriaceae bacterium]
MPPDSIPPDAITLARPVKGGQGYALRVVGENLVDLFALPRAGDLVIGRGVDADIKIDDASISRKHALLAIIASPSGAPPKLQIKDLGSQNGTRLADVTLEPGEWAELAIGDVVDLGSVMLIVMRGDAEPPAQREREGSAMGRVERLLERVAPGDIAVLIQGETGVGKEVFAERLHAKSRRAARPLLKLNCGGFTETLLDSELFGHEKGAFTGADKAKPGLLELADGGSVFLDEIGELPLGLQARLLRVLQDKKVQRIGALEPRAIDVRFLSATNRDLVAEVSAGRFRQDLYYRLNGVTLAIPPLRERAGEIAGLARTFLEDASVAQGRTLRLSRAALSQLEQHSWPGNIRELKNVIERAALICPDDEIDIEHLQLAPAEAAPAAGSLHADIESLERRRIIEALEACGGNQTRAAQKLGISRGTLVSRLKQFGITRPRS